MIYTVCILKKVMEKEDTSIWQTYIFYLLQTQICLSVRMGVLVKQIITLYAWHQQT
jgi:hypothetical protein